ncbi:entericidin A/B family lipoprotein [Fodinicurvata fenggangensis]|uniref:entericidin A/B family lipoprotein n=1 Tax=Fodinicurvata fenggangensis TaxID=1121830 RepID=UPI0009E05B7C|nr:entericidin A/B family lipoprotein [Fodinicurvata fenggangensis]
MYIPYNSYLLIVMVLIVLGVGVALSACNTIEGMGRDVELAGEATSETARDAKRELSN